MTTDVQLTSIYQHLILDHYRKPRNKGAMEAPTVEVHMRNPTCGDEVKLQLLLDGDTIADVRFTGEGCSISQASVSMMTARLKGKTLEEGRELAERFTEVMHGDEAAAKDRSLGDLRALAGVAKFPVRVKCALLGFDALLEAAGKAAQEAPSPDEGAPS
jgi:nitrogen fixation protein NifU and related proteins